MTHTTFTRGDIVRVVRGPYTGVVGTIITMPIPSKKSSNSYIILADGRGYLVGATALQAVSNGKGKESS